MSYCNQQAKNILQQYGVKLLKCSVYKAQNSENRRTQEALYEYKLGSKGNGNSREEIEEAVRTIKIGRAI